MGTVSLADLEGAVGQHIAFEVTRLRKTWLDGWQCNEWAYKIGTRKGKHSGQYYTGLGIKERPDCAGILHALLLDASANEESFNDWCDAFGYSNDSIKAFATYQQCCNTARDLLKVFSHQQLAKLRELLSDY